MLVAPRVDDWTPGAYAIDCSELLAHAEHWIHGHTHRVEDYPLRGCRVLSNPARDAAYDPTRCVELEITPLRTPSKRTRSTGRNLLDLTPAGGTIAPGFDDHARRSRQGCRGLIRAGGAKASSGARTTAIDTSRMADRPRRDRPACDTLRNPRVGHGASAGASPQRNKMSLSRRQRRIRFLEFLVIGIAMGLVEDMLGVWLATETPIDRDIVFIFLAVFVPFAAISELLVDNPYLWEVLLPRSVSPSHSLAGRPEQGRGSGDTGDWGRRRTRPTVCTTG